ncbi:uncharacterized protein DDB_G0287625-like isoform X2 [Ruditapes philippinarum]|uniref:uncharacterized protein DDB_G0287625-like isoform X2 n=1 Tax=Ruditapes philippinarum TaxID=129788 RepID=UPI00295AF312|nr:uncharacterized protein DDB_G0287625-like isoform X2 [Ruditapes philippinarum]
MRRIHSLVTSNGRQNNSISQRRRSRSRSRSRRSRSRSRCARDKCHSKRPRTPSPHRSRDNRPSGSGTSSSAIKIVRTSTPAREEVPLLPDIEVPLLNQLNEPEFPELFGTHLTNEMIWQMEEWRLEAEEHFDFSLLLSKNTKDSSKKVSRKRGRDDDTDWYPAAKRPAIHVNPSHPNFRRG